ncbi:MAG TPA: hypothetical protein PLC54_02130 [Spirochaetales bacterium]|nr:hypothetical protein [Spirochaetales bacterium]
MFATVYAAVLAAVSFYVILPLIGGVVVRMQWRSFRAAIMRAAVWPELKPDSPDGSTVQMNGAVDALEGKDLLWVRSDTSTALIPLASVPIYLLLGNNAIADSEHMERQMWKSMRSISPWAGAFIAGRLQTQSGRKTFAVQNPQPLLILHDNKQPLVHQQQGVTRSTLLETAIRRGRHSNEYWNPLTQIALASGLVVMSGIVSASLSANTPVLAKAVVLTAALSPLLPLLPPGVFLFFAYRFYWRRGRECRARRDVALFRGKLRSHRAWTRLSALWTGVSVLCFVGGFTVNACLIFIVLSRIL